MHFKTLIAATCFFWLAARRTEDEVWIFCTIISAALSACAFFYSLENRTPRSSGKAKKN